MHSRKSRRALDLDLRTNSLESRRLLATPTATVAMYHRTAVLTKTALVLGPDQYIIGPGPTLSAKVTLTKPLPVHQATGWNFTTNSFAPGSMHTIKAGTKVTFNYGPLQAHLLAKIEARYAAPAPHH
ncbi:MAG: hypothetical protein WBX00_32475 [Isosphaeraceae bacterium]